MSKCPVSGVIKVSVDFSLFSSSLDKILAAMTIAAERNNKERFASIVEGLENHEAQQLQVRIYTKNKHLTPLLNMHHTFITALLLHYFL